MSKLILWLLGFMSVVSVHFMIRLLCCTYTKEEVDEIISEVDESTKEEFHEKQSVRGSTAVNTKTHLK